MMHLSLWQHGSLLLVSYAQHQTGVLCAQRPVPCRYTSAFGSPVARIQGVGWIHELIARLTNTRIKVHNTSTNATLDDNDTTFPLGHSLYVDATHEVVFLNGAWKNYFVILQEEGILNAH